ncbi:glycoside hydrolase family 1 protein [Sphingomonas tabacisoli]|uniref:Glycoside hydrolase family 1 protein n=1 Tax=Sphingomonas tabacisoli TaxID=2249466 RepID=A0ABW4I7E1_9SPHN
MIEDQGFERRSVLAGIGAAAATAAALPASAAATKKAFPNGFSWGASTAGYQVEGNNVNADLWLMEHIKPQTFTDLSGDADDSYHRWRDDIALMKAIGLNAYRFSIEWSRIEPARGQFSRAELDHYKRFIAALRDAEIEPVMTFFHVAAPRWFAEAGGWLNPESPDLFANYCDKAMRALGGEIGIACTINEPQVGLTYRVIPQANAYFGKEDARQLEAHREASRVSGSTRYVTMNHPDVKGMTPQLMAAHERSVAAIKAVRRNVPTGVTLNIVDFQPANEGSKYRELRKLAFGPWLEVAARSGDFVGGQAYRQVRVPGSGAKLPGFPEMPFVAASEEQEVIKQPVALRNAVEYVHAETRKPILVTENGLETHDDRRRAWYIPQALSELHGAIAGGVPVIGYLHWSLLDNFEWLLGYSKQFGLATVDRETFARKLKPSAAVYRSIIRRNAV